MTHHSKTTTVEFIGLPGAGKTTISQLLAKRTEARLVSVKAPSFNKAIRAPLASFTEVTALARCNASARSALFTHKLVGYPSLEIHVARGSDLTIIEEGWLHELWRAVFLNPSMKICDYEPLFRRHRNVVALEVDPEVRFQRLHSRPLPGHINAILAQSGPTTSEWERSITTYQALIDLCERHNNSIRINTETELPEIVDSLVSWVKEIQE